MGNERLTNYLNGMFAPYEGVSGVAELKADLLSDLQERFLELKAEGLDEETAFQRTIDSIGDIEQTIREVGNLSGSADPRVPTNFRARHLPKSDLSGVVMHNGDFQWSALRGTDFSGADLTGSSFQGSDLKNAVFDAANLTDCNFSMVALGGASFHKSNLVRTNFSMSALAGAKFTDVRFDDVKLTMASLKHTLFEHCVFDGVNFAYSDLRGLCLDGQTFIGLTFDKAALSNASFKGATLNNVSFLPPPVLGSKKYFRALKQIHFDGARMDKLTYAALRGMGANLVGVTVI